MSIKKILVAINAKYIHSNLAVYSIKAYSESEMYKADNIHIAEYTINNRVEDIIDDIYIRKPELLAFSCYIWNIEYVCKIINEINKLLPHCHIWLGGPEVSYNTDYYLDRFPFLKGIMIGEGEETFAELTSFYEQYGLEKNMFSDIAGIVTQEKRRADERLPIEMSKLPFPYKELKSFDNRIIYYESSRGCPYSCSYCLSCIDKKLRFRDIELVKEELKFFISNRVNQVKFIDRTFNCNRQRAVEIWKYILDNDNGVTNFHFEVASDLIDDEQIRILKAMRPGLVQLEIGVQSTNKETLTAIRRNMDIEKLKSVVKELKENGNIHIHLDLIAGLPYENINSFKNSFNDVYAMKPDELQLGFLKVLYGAYMYEDAKKYGIIYKSYPPYEVLYTSWLRYEDVLTLKSVEEVLEIYYGSGQFTYSVKYLSSFFETPFDFYNKLGEFYSKSHVCGSKHSRMERYNILLDFANNTQIEDLSEHLLSELLTIDIYLRENSKSRPLFALDLTDYRERIKEMARKHNISKSDHIEILSLDAVKYIKKAVNNWNDDLCIDELKEELLKETTNLKCEKRLVYAGFDYSDISPVTQSARIYILK